jgi:hypothetical protein
VVVDPSHAAGRRDLVVPLTRAAIAVGADAVMVDVHADPTSALCDGPQALYGEELDLLAAACRDLPGWSAARPPAERPLLAPIFVLVRSAERGRPQEGEDRRGVLLRPTATGRPPRPPAPHRRRRRPGG